MNQHGHTMNEEEPKFTPMAEPLVEAALAEIRARSFSGRNAQLGKMIKCQFCQLRHRENERKCEQYFTNVVDGYEVFREDESGTLVPDFRTCLRSGERPTIRQQIGAAALVKKRFHPHPSKIKLQFIERVRLVFEFIGYPTEPKEGQDTAQFEEQFKKDLHEARVYAARLLRKEREKKDRAYRRRRDQARRINAGLKLGRNRA